MANVHLAQINIGRMRGVFEDPVMAGFVARLEELNALADGSEGFVWRLQGGEGNATYLRPYDDERIIVNMSVWQSLEHLRAYAYNSAHAEVLRQRREWFEKFDGVMMALWWIPVGRIPSIDEGKKRLASIAQHGSTPFAFTFKTSFPPDEVLIASTDWSSFLPCPA
jgi:heme-degrading monooxygenase HmoA